MSIRDAIDDVLELEEAKMSDEDVLKAAKSLAANGKDEKAKKFGQGLVDFYKKNDSFTPDQVAGLQNIMKNASFQLAKESSDEDEMEDDSEENEIEIKETRKKYKMKKESSNMKEDVDALISGEELSEEFKEKAATIFEAAVLKRVKEELTSIEESFEEKYAEQLDEQVEQIKEGLIEQVDGYLDYMVEQWVERNEIALENGMKSDIMEDFMSGLKSLFKEHYIDIPDEKLDLVESLEDKVQDLTEKLNEETSNNIKISKKIKALEAKAIVEEQNQGLTETEKEKFNALIEELDVTDLTSFSNKVKTIRESYFTQKPTKTVETIVTDKPVIEEETKPKQFSNPQMKSYLSILDSLK